MLYQNPVLDFFSLLRPIRKPRIWLYLAYLSILNEYRRTLLGPLWILLSLVIFSLAIGSVYSGLFSIGYFEYIEYMATGMIGWNWIGAIIISSGMIYVTNSGLLLNQPTDKAYLIWAHAMSQFITLLHQLPFIFLFYLFGALPVNVNVLYIIPSLAIMFFINIGAAAILSVVVTRYRDLHKILTSLVIIIMIMTPIFWKPDMVTGGRALTYLLNPFYYMVEIIRNPLLGKDPVMFNYAVSCAIAVIVMVLGCYVHKKYSKYVVFRL